MPKIWKFSRCFCQNFFLRPRQRLIFPSRHHESASKPKTMVSKTTSMVHALVVNIPLAEKNNSSKLTCKCNCTILCRKKEPVVVELKDCIIKVGAKTGRIFIQFLTFLLIFPACGQGLWWTMIHFACCGKTHSQELWPLHTESRPHLRLLQLPDHPPQYHYSMLCTIRK